MKVYLAGTNSFKRILTADVHYAPVKPSSNPQPRKIFILESFYYLRDWMMSFIDTHWNFMLDSGAFTFFGQKNKQIDWNEYLERYATFITQNKINLFFELDIDVILGLEKVEAIRKNLEKLTGKQSIPVWRPSRGFGYWEKMCAEFSYVAISASGNYDSSWTRRKGAAGILRQMVASAHKKGAKVHGLGYTDLKNLSLIGFDSVDSTAWLYGNMVGHVCKFDGKTVVKKVKPDGMKLKNRESSFNNFSEWLKFQRYAEHHL
jgi:hypothetical protein